MSDRDEDAVVKRVRAAIQKLLYDDVCRESDKIISYGEVAETALRALRPGDPLPGGGVWMPVEPTEAMTQAGRGCLCRETACWCDQNAIYRAMGMAASEEKP
jgi:hypothetical protein